MLVLSRKVMEAITIGDDIKIVIVDARRNRVRLAIEAPSETPIRRVLVANESAAAKPLEPQVAPACPTL